MRREQTNFKMWNRTVHWQFCFLVTFVIKTVGNFWRYGYLPELSFFHFKFSIVHFSVQMLPVTSAEERYQKCTFSEENRHLNCSYPFVDHQYSFHFQWNTEFYLQYFKNGGFRTRVWPTCEKDKACTMLLTSLQFCILTQNVCFSASVCIIMSFRKLWKRVKTAPLKCNHFWCEV